MKQTKEHNHVSRYYSALLTLTAGASLLILALLAIASVFTLTHFSIQEATLRSIIESAYLQLMPFVLLDGGFTIGYVILRRKRLSRRELVTWSGAIGLSAVALDDLLTVSVDTLLQDKTYILNYFFLYRALIVLAIVTATLLLLSAKAVQWRKWLMNGFLVVFWLGQAAVLVETLVIVTGHFAGASIATEPWYMVLLGIVNGPIITTLVFYLLLRRIGRRARFFYATLFAALIASVAQSIWLFSTSPQMAAYQLLATVDGAVSLGCFIVLAIATFLLRPLE